MGDVLGIIVAVAMFLAVGLAALWLGLASREAVAIGFIMCTVSTVVFRVRKNRAR